MPESALIVAEEPRAIIKIREQLDLRVDEIAGLLPPGMDPQRFARVSLMAISKNQDILACSPASIVLSIIEAAQVGLEPTGGVGGAHLVPFRQKDGPAKAQLIYDYRGVQHLIREGGGGEVKTVLVFEGDDFDVYEGTSPRIEHVARYKTSDPSKITYVYAWPLDHPAKFEVMPKVEIDRIRARSKASNFGPWVTDYGAMARKSVLKRLSAWLPLIPKIRAVLELDTQREIGPVVELPAESRTSRVKDRLKARKELAPGGSESVTPTDAPGARERADADVRVTDEAAGQDDPEPSATEICGAVASDGLMTGAICTLDAGHQGAHRQDDKGSWPAEKS